jgi:chromosomal replication initiation ATPase DnaA
MASLLKRPIDPELTLVALRKLAPIAALRRALEIGDVVATVARTSSSRPTRSPRARAGAMCCCRASSRCIWRTAIRAHRCRRSEPALGRDHSAAANAVRKIERRILEPAPLRYQVEALCARLDGMVGERRE